VSLKDREKPGRELYMITVAGQPQTRSVNRIGCILTKLSFSPDGQWAVAQGDNQAPPFLVNFPEQSCVRIDRRESIRVLAWAPDESTDLAARRAVERIDLEVVGLVPGQPPLVPELHGQADNVIPFRPQHGRDSRGIDSARHGCGDGFGSIVHCNR